MSSYASVLGQAPTAAVDAADRRCVPGHTAIVNLEASDGKTYACELVYCVAGGTITAGYYCQLNGDAPFEVTNARTAITANVLSVGMAMSAATAGQYFWVMKWGVDTVNTWASLTAPDWINANATTGELTAAGNSTPAATAVGVGMDNDVVFILPPGQGGTAADA